MKITLAKKIICMSAFLFLFSILLNLLPPDTHAQLIVNDKNMKVVAVDTKKMRIEICGVDDPADNTTGYVYVDGYTETFKDGKTFDWKNLKKGWIIRVKGGVRWDMNLKAQKIWVIKL